LHFNCCLTAGYSETTAHCNSNFDTDTHSDFFFFFFFFYYWALVASAPRSTATCRLIVQAQLWKFLLA
jgi:hypothetical protein